MHERGRMYLWEATVALTGFMLGYAWANNPEEVRNLRTDLKNAREALIASESRRTGFSKAWINMGQNPITSVTRSDNTPYSERLSEAKITEEDIAESLALQKKQEDGEFILSNERPFFRKLKDLDFKEIASRTAANNAKAYEEIFSKAGLNPEQSQKFQSHLAKIHRASLEAEEAIAQVLNARMQYDLRIRAILSSEQYGNYRRYETLKPAQAEFGSLQAFLYETEKTSVDPKFSQTLIDMIHDAHAVDAGSWHGPYDPLPDVRLGDEQIVAKLKQEIEGLDKGSIELIRQISAADLPAEYREHVARYYQKKSERKQLLLDHFAQRLVDNN